MGKLFDLVTERQSLYFAWRHVHSNGMSSKSEDTRIAIEQFGQDPLRNVNSLQSLLRSNAFSFDQQTGILKAKSSGKKRGIVLASVRNRIVERAILDVLQQKCEFIQDVNNCEFSVGGVPDRSVPHGLKIVLNAFETGKRHFARSDIAGFFDHVPRRTVIDFLSARIDEKRFIGLIEDATTVTLANESALGEDRKLFPSNDEGVAQGSPLSPLFGNILLSDFDNQLNSDDITCVRFIDDFVILGKTPEAVKLAFDNASEILSNLGLDCQNPYVDKCDPAKADYGPVESKIVFLGHQIQPGLLQPSRDARQELLSKIRSHLSIGRASIKQVKSEKDSFAARFRYAQTLDVIDKVITGWSQAFAYCDSESTFDDLDTKIDEELLNFRKFYRLQIEGLNSKERRRLAGVRLVKDVPRRTFDRLPKIIKINSKYIRETSMRISTDGSVIVNSKKSKSKKGPGGWAFVRHNSDEAESGFENDTTNNRMELLAVIKALEHYPAENLVIRTDSQYVSMTAGAKQTTKQNHDLWDRFQSLCDGRKVRIDWVKGHSGDQYNELADKMANAQARSAT